MVDKNPSSDPANMVHTIHNDILTAAMLLTRIPVRRPETDKPDTARSYWSFGLIGLAVAGPVAMLGAVLLNAGIPPLAASVLIVGAIALLTGGMHQDGLADTADSLGGGDPERRLAIMHDSSIGSFGVVALVCVSIATIASIATLARHGPEIMVGGVIAAAAMSRSMMAVQRRLHNPPSEKGLAHRTGRPSSVMAMTSVAVSLLLAIIFSWVGAALLALIAGLAVTLLLGVFLRHWIGGVNGDGLGATQQLSEAVMLMSLCAVLG